MLGMTLLLALTVAARAGELSVRVLDAAGKPVENAVVYLRDLPESARGGEGVMDQVDTEFMPHVLAIRAGTKVRFPNKDQVHHQIYSFSKAKRFEQPLYKGADAAPVLFDKPGVVKLACNIHDWMAGYIVVVAHQHFGMTGPDGTARFSAPKGAHEIAVWSERLKGSSKEAPPHPVQVGSGKQSVTIAIKAGPAPKPLPRDRNRYQ